MSHRTMFGSFVKPSQQHNEHEEDHSDDEKEAHHHDDHSRHAHQHEVVRLAGGGILQINVFNDYPKHGKPYHLHTVLTRDAANNLVSRRFFHEGVEHTDVPKDHPHAWIYNNKKDMKFPCRGLAPLAVGHHGHDSSSDEEEDRVKHTRHVPKPSAPPAPTHYGSGSPAFLSPKHRDEEQVGPDDRDKEELRCQCALL